MPRQDELTLDPDAAYVHYTTNNTIFGTEWSVRAGRRRTCRSSPTRRRTSSAGRSTSAKFGLIYAGAQKNLAPAGVTLVIIREDLLARTPKTLPTMLQYPVHVENKSMYNTPPVFAIYIMRLVLKWLLKEGGLRRWRAATRARPASSMRRSTAPASTAATRRRTAARG